MGPAESSSASGQETAPETAPAPPTADSILKLTGDWMIQYARMQQRQKWMADGQRLVAEEQAAAAAQTAQQAAATPAAPAGQQSAAATQQATQQAAESTAESVEATQAGQQPAEQSMQQSNPKQKARPAQRQATPKLASPEGQAKTESPGKPEKPRANWPLKPLCKRKHPLRRFRTPYTGWYCSICQEASCLQYDLCLVQFS